MFGNGYNAYSGFNNIGAKKGLLTGLASKWDWSTILGNTQKTLGIINQAIPIMYQIKPIITNASTIFKIMGAIKDDDTPRSKTTQKTTNQTPKTNKSTIQNINTNYTNDNDGPQFFL